MGPALCRWTGLIRANPGLYSPDGNAESRESSILNIPFPKRSVLSSHHAQLAHGVPAPLPIALSPLVSSECHEVVETQPMRPRVPHLSHCSAVPWWMNSVFCGEEAVCAF